MSDAVRLVGDGEPLGLWLRPVAPPAEAVELRVEALELSSRGDRVTGRLLRPCRANEELPCPLVLLAGTRAACDLAGLAAARRWAERGVAVAALDLPLHGARADHKTLALLSPADEAAEPGPVAAALAGELGRQALCDLARGLDALSALDGIDPARLLYVGLRLGAVVGAAFCALDARPRAAVLAPGGGEAVSAGIDPLRYVGRIAPRPLLVVAAEPGAARHVPAEALLAAARDPVEALRLEAPPDALEEAVLEAAWSFAACQLGIAAAARAPSR